MKKAAAIGDQNAPGDSEIEKLFVELQEGNYAPIVKELKENPQVVNYQSTQPHGATLLLSALFEYRNLLEDKQSNSKQLDSLQQLIMTIVHTARIDFTLTDKDGNNALHKIFYFGCFKLNKKQPKQETADRWATIAIAILGSINNKKRFENLLTQRNQQYNQSCLANILQENKVADKHRAQIKVFQEKIFAQIDSIYEGLGYQPKTPTSLQQIWNKHELDGDFKTESRSLHKILEKMLTCPISFEPYQVLDKVKEYPMLDAKNGHTASLAEWNKLQVSSKYTNPFNRKVAKPIPNKPIAKIIIIFQKHQDDENDAALFADLKPVLEEYRFWLHPLVIEASNNILLHDVIELLASYEQHLILAQAADQVVEHEVADEDSSLLAPSRAAAGAPVSAQPPGRPARFTIAAAISPERKRSLTDGDSPSPVSSSQAAAAGSGPARAAIASSPTDSKIKFLKFRPTQWVHLPEYRQFCKRDHKVEADKTVYIFPGNTGHHRADNSLYRIKTGGGLANLAQALGEAHIACLSLPTTGMLALDSKQAHQLKKIAVADIWRAMGYGLTPVLITRKKQYGRGGQPLYFKDELTPGQDDEPSMWGSIEKTPHFALADYYMENIKLMVAFAEGNHNIADFKKECDAKQIAFPQAFVVAFSQGQTAAQAVGKPAWFFSRFHNVQQALIEAIEICVRALAPKESGTRKYKLLSTILTWLRQDPNKVTNANKHIIYSLIYQIAHSSDPTQSMVSSMLSSIFIANTGQLFQSHTKGSGLRIDNRYQLDLASVNESNIVQKIEAILQTATATPRLSNCFNLCG